jgi:hypothetical protein
MTYPQSPAPGPRPGPPGGFRPAPPPGGPRPGSFPAHPPQPEPRGVAAGHDAAGHDAAGHDAAGHDAAGRDADGRDAEGYAAAEGERGNGSDPVGGAVRSTGHPAVDAVLRSLANAAGLAPADQIAEYEAAHQVLQETLAGIDG